MNFPGQTGNWLSKISHGPIAYFLPFQAWKQSRLAVAFAEKGSGAVGRQQLTQ